MFDESCDLESLSISCDSPASTLAACSCQSQGFDGAKETTNNKSTEDCCYYTPSAHEATASGLVCPSTSGRLQRYERSRRADVSSRLVPTCLSKRGHKRQIIRRGACQVAEGIHSIFHGQNVLGSQDRSEVGHIAP